MTRGPWRLPDPRQAQPGVELLALSGPLTADVALAGYRRGLFAMEVAEQVNGWFSPDPRGILLPESLHISRSLRRSMRGFRITVDQQFAAVVRACADPDRAGAWINAEYVQVYQELHTRGLAHSVEVWSRDHLVGGVFGVELGGLFCGESMFHRQTDASKAALVGLVERLVAAGPRGRILDVQWWTPHLGTLGVIEVPRLTYLDSLPPALALPAAFD